MEKIRKKTKKVSLKKVAWKSGTMHFMDVYSQTGEILGKGYIISFTNETMSEPMLFNFGGEQLPPGLYGLKIYDYQSCVVAKNEQ